MYPIYRGTGVKGERLRESEKGASLTTSKEKEIYSISNSLCFSLQLIAMVDDKCVKKTLNIIVSTVFYYERH